MKALALTLAAVLLLGSGTPAHASGGSRGPVAFAAVEVPWGMLPGCGCQRPPIDHRR